MKKMSYAEAIREGMSIRMREDPSVLLFGEDVGAFGGCFGVTAGMFDEFGDKRVRDTPISEGAIIGAAVGSAATGLRPIAELMFCDFLTVGMDQLVNQAAKMRYMFGGKISMPMVVRLPGGAGVSAAAQHSQSLEAWVTHVPGLKVVYPSTPQDALGLMLSSIDSTGALSLKVLPKSMVVIGGGVIGLELACAYAAFGTKITVVEAMDHMLPMLDGDLTKIGVEHMKKMGMDFHLECPVQAVESSSVGAKVICKNKAGETVSFEAEKVLVAIGRKANTAMLDLDAGKLDNDRGRIKVNDKMETSVPGVYAIGDCVMGYAQLAHTASAMGEVAAENICGHEVHYDESTNPTCVYIEPEAASVGLTEEQCKAKGIAYKVGKFPMSANGKALILNGGEGLVKLIAGAKYGEILGMHIIGPRATDLISEGALAIRLEATVDELISTIHSHPTVTETLREAALNVEKRAIHTPNR